MLRLRRDTPDSETSAFSGEEGYLLIGLVVAIFLLTLFLTIAAPTVARELERDREVESEHRAKEYVQALHNYYVRVHSYPTSMDQLLNTNNQHFLRQAYKDPLTGGEYRLIHFGENKTQVKGFFGEPLEGAPMGGGLGALAGSVANLGANAGSSSGFGSSQSGGSSFGSSSFGSSGASGLGSGSSGLSGSSGSSFGGSNGTSGTSSTSGTLSGGSTSATSFQGSKGAIIGVGSNKQGRGMIEWNGSTNIQDWEFLYDPRVDILKQRVSILGGSPAENGGGSLGSLSGSAGSSSGSSTSGFGSSSGSSSSGSSSFGSGSSGSSSSGSSSFGSSSFGSSSSGTGSSSSFSSGSSSGSGSSFP